MMKTDFHRLPSTRLLVHMTTRDFQATQIGTVTVDDKEVPVVELNGRAVSLVQVALDARENSIGWQELD
ncbi:hypothetical protein [Rhodococcus erythropolis]|uniref:hypothetical protein n=1 Tax=Rhodococcus erythropolis TaxID=1833 RepID=UPI002227EA76|nr:hypothetical protein [Rhodococcus erythropolis]MCW2295533.1 hypothetical protein [Rhodococcus erythropolis]